MSKKKKSDMEDGNEQHNKSIALKEAISQINTEYGDGSVMILGDDHITEKVGVVPTGSLLLDKALGVNGLPRGRITEIFGNEGSGKTTISLHVIANAQKTGGVCAFVDVEHALDINYAEKIGVDVKNLIISQPSSGEQAMEIVEKLLKSKAVDVIVVDSVAALIPKSELEGNMEDHVMGGLARLMSKGMRKITHEVKASNAVCIFINQIRLKIGVMFGNPETTTGGNALKFYASVRLEVRKKTLIKKGEEVIGQDMEVKILKNKLASPFKKVEFELIYGKGINTMGELIDLCVTQGIIQKSGSWFSYEDKKIGQGKDSVIKLLQSDEELQNKLLSLIK